MTPRVRKAALVAHVVFSVGWLGAVLAFLALAMVGLSNGNPTIVRSAYIAMDLLGWYVIVPLSVAALASGVIQSVGTEWGLFQHYWVVVKLLLTAFAAAMLPVHLRISTRLSAAALSDTLGPNVLSGLRWQIAGDAALTVPLLLLLTMLSIYKPWGKVGFVAPAARPRMAWGRYVLMALAAAGVAIIVAHLAGGHR